MGIKNIVLKILAGIAAVASAIFYVLFQQAKSEKNKVQADLQETKADLQEAERDKSELETVSNIADAVNRVEVEEAKENEKLKQDAIGHKPGNFNSKLELLRKQASAGNQV